MAAPTLFSWHIRKLPADSHALARIPSCFCRVIFIVLRTGTAAWRDRSLEGSMDPFLQSGARTNRVNVVNKSPVDNNFGMLRMDPGPQEYRKLLNYARGLCFEEIVLNEFVLLHRSCWCIHIVVCNLNYFSKWRSMSKKFCVIIDAIRSIASFIRTHCTRAHWRDSTIVWILMRCLTWQCMSFALRLAVSFINSNTYT